MKYINLIGVELEGGWEKIPQDVQMKRDGSLQQLKGVVGEIVSSPLNLPDIIKFINKFWPDYRNDTCGFHIHVSFKDLKYMRMVRATDFFDAFQLAVAKFSQANRMNQKWWKRFHGKNRYCKKQYIPGDKYVHINYLHRETIENRLGSGAIPKGKAIKYVQWYVNFVEEFIEKKIRASEPQSVQLKERNSSYPPYGPLRININSDLSFPFNYT